MMGGMCGVRLFVLYDLVDAGPFSSVCVCASVFVRIHREAEVCVEARTL